MINRAMVLGALWATILGVTILPVRAEPLEIRSTNFIFVGDVREDDALKLVKDLEIYRATVLALAGLNSRTEVRPVRIYGVGSGKEISKFTNMSNIGGVYTLRDDYPVFVMVSDGGFDDEDFSRHVALHEYAHHIIGSYTEEYFPHWFNEGFAEYIAAFKVEGDLVSIGMPTSRFGNILQNKNWMDIDTVLNAITRYPDFGGANRVRFMRGNMFYGISWIAVHYIQNTPELSSRLGDYIGLINQGVEPTEAFEKGFGITQDEFADLLRDYWRANRFASVQFRYTEEIFKDTIEVRRLDRQDFDLIMLGGKRIFYPHGDDGKKARRTIARNLDDLEERHGPAPVIARARMALALSAKDHGDAVARGEAAIAAFPGSPDAHLTAGDAYYHRYADTEDPDPVDLEKARYHLGEVVKADPTNPTATGHYISTFTFDRSQPDALALGAVDFLASYRRNPVFWQTHLELGEVLLLAGEPERACSHIAKVAQWVRRDAERAAEEAANRDEPDEEAKDTFSSETSIDRLNRLLETPGFECPTEP
ncbi:hypothetical protein [Aquisalinus flavus]|uniref:DUF1570 domain-containing protein n=1 Tax=Aquisalinus flavus TaxID=1526572 RepID=A0A8J2Y3N4_9PROT|nr:hypothetical protein [Aquisalinus flavus]MBD0426508.1 hypothetical protein [Aquisalinus flavus]UNE47940.1 hypothetical protein FF099_07710 [Aquisalinus flavus]GGD07402.1 hypothetical protein GCM10011342_15260 [Aquisalinus flavus]